jgi:hypothetical protein
MVKFTTVTWYSQLLAIVLGIGIFGAGFLIGSKVEQEKVQSQTNLISPTSTEEVTINTTLNQNKVVGFTWRHHVIDENADYPKSVVSLVTNRADGTNQEKEVATVDGSCNIMPTEAKLALNSEQLLCYYAGFGYQFRVISVTNGYEVQQKEIEEASPDYNPPIGEFKTILKIGL